MAIRLDDGYNPENVEYNSTALDKVTYDGVTVWERKGNLDDMDCSSPFALATVYEGRDGYYSEADWTALGWVELTTGNGLLVKSSRYVVFRVSVAGAPTLGGYSYIGIDASPAPGPSVSVKYENGDIVDTRAYGQFQYKDDETPKWQYYMYLSAGLNGAVAIRVNGDAGYSDLNVACSGKYD